MSKMRYLVTGLALGASVAAVRGEEPRVETPAKPAEVAAPVNTAPRAELAPFIETVKQSLPAGGRVIDQPISPVMIRQVATLFKEEARAEQIVQGFHDARAFVWVPGEDPSRQVAFSVMRFDSPVRAARYFGFAVDMQRKADELMASACASTVKVHRSGSQAIVWPGCDEGVCADKQLEMVAERRIIATCVLVIRSGDTVIEINAHGINLDADWAKQAVATMLPAARGSRAASKDAAITIEPAAKPAEAH